MNDENAAPPVLLDAVEDIGRRITAALDRNTAAIERLVQVMEQEAEPEVPVVLRPASPKGARLRA